MLGGNTMLGFKSGASATISAPLSAKPPKGTPHEPTMKRLSPEAALASVATAYLPLLQEVREYLDRELTADGFLPEDVRMLVLGGKMLRPLLVLLACDVVGGTPQAVISAAAAIEMAHTSSLIHDDIMDKAELRRGAPAAHVRYGLDRAILFGDYLLIKAFEQLALCRWTGASAERIVRSFLLTARGGIEMTRGQLRELEHSLPSGAMISHEIDHWLSSHEGDADEREYIQTLAGKTGALLAATLAVGASLGGGLPEEVAALYGYGLNVGVAFQIRDDVLDLTSQDEDLGKPVTNCLVTGAPNLALLHAKRINDKSVRAQLECCLQSAGAGGSNSTAASSEESRQAAQTMLVALLSSLGSIDYAQTMARRYAAAGLDTLAKLPPGDARSALATFVHFAVERNR
jgi:geranylgeranyl diphosphate synthase type I